MKLLFIGSRLFDDVDYYLKEKGIESLLTESNENAINLDLPDKVFIVPRGMDEPAKIAISNNVDAIVPLIGIDPPLRDVAIMKEDLEGKIPVIASDINAAEITFNKIKTKKFFNENNINTPDYQVITSPSELKLEFPVVLKQSAGQGGKDIKIANSIIDVEEYFKKFSEALAEKFVEGSEISIEVLAYNGEIVPLVPIYKGETTLVGTHPLNKIKTAPVEIEGFDSEKVCEVAYKVAKDLDSDGIFEMDFMYSKNGELFVIEVNTRPNGTRFLTTAACGINSMHELVNMAIGEFSEENIKNKISNYYATEIPIGNYEGPKHSEPLKSFEKDNFVVHGPEGYQRITLRANSKKELEDLKNILMNN